MKVVLSIILSALASLAAHAAPGADRPNVLWITLEDTSPHFIGCYGNTAARTPNIDRLAARGIRFDRAFANAPVCSSARSTIITGTLNEVLGTGNHRSALPLPERIQGFPTFLRKAGYYTSNNKKTDYSTSSDKRIIRQSWNESSGKAGWWKRKPSQPFFSVFNIEDCHQSRTMTWSYDWYRKNIYQRLGAGNRIAEDAFPVPPFLPDTPGLRKHFARVYNSIARADEKVGELVARLDSDGLTEDTIIFCYADHGEAMPRGKANPIGLGYRVPFIVVFPEKWQHLNPWGTSGTTTDELICFDDLGPTMLSLAGVRPAPWMTGRPLLGEHRAAPRPHAFCSRNRIDEGTSCARSITDGRYLYTRHFLPGPEFQRLKYFDVADISRLLRRSHAAGTLDEVQDRMFRQTPHELLYDLESDPWELNNLADDPEFSGRLSKLREELFRHIIEVRDMMLRPEYELARISQSSTVFDQGVSEPENELESILRAADIASRPGVQAEIPELLTHDSPVVRYWAATALRGNPDYPRDSVTYAELDYPPAEIELAAARLRFDQNPDARALLEKHALSSDPHLRLHALQRIQDFGAEAGAFKETLEKSLKNGTYDTRCSAEMTLHLIDQRGISYPDPN